MKPEVSRCHVGEEFETEERCSIIEIANDAGDKEVSISRARVLPDVTTAWHWLVGISERYIITSGKGRVYLGDLEPEDVTVGDVVRIPPGSRQRITNTGTADLIFYCVCSPPFRSDCYVSLE